MHTRSSARRNAKANVVPPHAMKALGGEEIYEYILLVLDLGTRWG
jgi:hypothetical protein